MFEIKVTLTATPELLAVLTAIAGLGTTMQMPNKAADGGSAAASQAEAKKIVESATKVKEPAPEKDKPETEISIEQVRAAVQKKSQDGHRERIKALLTEFGADKVTTLDKSKYAEFLKRVEEIDIPF